MATMGLSVRIEGLKECQAQLRKMPEEAKSDLRDAAWEIAQDMAGRLRIAARASSPQSALMAPEISTADIGIMPSVKIGGSNRVGRRLKPAYKILFGAEFGATVLHQFRPRNTAGYWLYPTVTAMSPEIGDKWREAADKVVNAFCSGA
jgi:hypothetical protein